MAEQLLVRGTTTLLTALRELKRTRTTVRVVGGPTRLQLCRGILHGEQIIFQVESIGEIPMIITNLGTEDKDRKGFFITGYIGDENEIHKIFYRTDRNTGDWIFLR